MTSTGSALLVAIVVIVGGMSLVSAGAPEGGPVAQADQPDVQPGERMAGIIGVQDAEIEGELAERTFGVKVAQTANDDAAKADVVVAQLEDIEARLAAMDDRMAELTAARERGEIQSGQYNAQVAKIAAERATAERLAGQSHTVATSLPADVLEERNINVSAIETLRDRAHDLGGPEVAAIARTIAGPEVGQPMTETAREHAPREPGPPEDRAPGSLPPDDDDEASDDETASN